MESIQWSDCAPENGSVGRPSAGGDWFALSANWWHHTVVRSEDSAGGVVTEDWMVEVRRVEDL